MGMNASKRGNSLTASTQASVSKIDKSICTKGNTTQHLILLDPRSPDINRTPLTRVLPIRLRDLEPTPSVFTPTTPLNSSKQKKCLDPRSPSQFIPRTPLNMSHNGDDIETTNAQYSLEYSGCFEEASCRNFNERLENITFDSFAEKKSEKKNMENEKVMNEKQITECKSTPKENRYDMNVYNDIENISPLVETASCNRQNAFSSTPISTLHYTQQTSLLLKKQVKIFEDAKNTNILENATSIKTMNNNKELRTPFESLLNRRSNSFESLSQLEFGFKPISNINDEKFTPKKRTRATTRQAKLIAGGIQRKQQIFCD